MELKPSSLFVSLVSLLGIIFPGAVVTFLALRGWEYNLLPKALVGVEEGSVEGWTLFIVVSYVAGQLLYAIGSWVLDPIYDRTYRWYKTSLKGDPKRFVFPLINQAFPQGDPPSAYSWSRAFVVTRAGNAVPELEQLEADFKFFRGLALALLIGPYEALRFERPVGLVASLAVVAVAFGIGVKVVDDLASTVRPLDPTRKSRLLDASLILMLTGVLFGFATGGYLVWTHVSAGAGAAYLIAAIVVALRFCQQRWQRNETTYEYASAVASSPGLPVSKTNESARLPD